MKFWYLILHFYHYFRYNTETYANDIALVKLQRPVVFRKGLRPACLPEKYKNFDLSGLEKNSAIIGWGKTSQYSSTVNHLREAYVPMSDTCKTLYKRAGFDIGPKQICAGGQAQDTCKGDSGGPLLNNELNENGKWAVIGITSFGPDQCSQETGVPGIYTRVDQYLDWIANNTVSS